MIYIWLDESDKKGQYYSNFYGGILIEGSYFDGFISRLSRVLDQNEIYEEIKWTNTNAFTFDKYKKVVDFLFDEMTSGFVKIRIFFRNNQYKAIGLTQEQKENEFTILYYEFIKHAFGLSHCKWPGDKFVRLYIDDIPARGSQVAEFKRYILGLNRDPGFYFNNVFIRENDIIEVDSKKQLPLQLLDLILGAMSFRLNNKHKIKDANTGKRGKRTILKESLYKYIHSKICVFKPNFNIGISTGIVSLSDRWTHPYRHWDFHPKECFRDYSESKP